MPFTPFHFGPALALKAVAPRAFSWTAFVASQVVIDCEPLYYMLRGDYPVHRVLHWFVGATGAGLAAAVACLLVVRLAGRLTPERVVSLARRSTATAGELSTWAILLGGLVGGLSHPLLDGFMHADLTPLMPWSQWNPFLGVVGLVPIHLGCLAAALAGVIGLALRR